MLPRPHTMTRTQWLVCTVASIGFAFDIYELLMLPLVLPPAIQELGKIQLGTPQFAQWRDLMFYLPAVCGGIFGLLGGYLTDRLGRRFVLTWSILIYAFSAFAAGFATSLPQLLFLRCTTFIGVCVEFVAAVAWLAELFPDSERREKIIGYTQAFGSLGGLMVTGAYYLIVTNEMSFPLIRGEQIAWRYTLISGLIPAIPLILIRPFLPESPAWMVKKRAGTLKRPSFAELFAPEFRTTTIVTTVMMACVYAAAFGAIQQMPRIVPGLEEVRALERTAQEQTISGVQSFQEFGGLAGRVLLAGLAAVIVGRRRLLYLFQIPGLFILPAVYFLVPSVGLTLAQWGIFAVGLATISQMSFWGNYLPRVYPTHLRGTGESFAANVGGRMIGTCAALITTSLVTSMPGGAVPIRLSYAAGIVGTTAYVIAVVASKWLPEPKGEALPE